LWCQQAPTTPKSSPPRSSSTSRLDLSFGPAVSNPEGKAAAEKLLQALGGPAKVNGVKTLHQNVVALEQGQRIEIDQSIVYPDKQAQRLTMAQRKMLLVTTSTDAFMVVGEQARSLPPDQRDLLAATLKHDFINVLQHIDDPKYIFNANGQENLDGAAATVVDVEAEGIATRWWIASDGKLLRERYAGEHGQIQIMTYSDWKNFGGLQYPTKYETFDEAGRPELSMTLIAMQLNPVVNPRIFLRPAAVAGR
jgi:outer membrane lipoprotein-sorting protein